MELIEQDWARAADAEQPEGGTENTNGIAESENAGALEEQSAIEPLNK